MIHFSNLQKAHLKSEEVNAMIEAILLLAKNDISRLTTIIKDETFTQAGNYTSAIVREIQGYDWFEQRCNHVIALNTAAIRKKQRFGFIPSSRKHNRYNVHDLNRLQFRHAWTDFKTSFTNVREIASSLSSINPLCANIYETDFITGRKVMEAAIQGICKSLEEIASNTAEWEFSDIHHYHQEIKAVYSSAVERKLLETFVGPSHDGHVDADQSEDNSIDLFEQQ